jgi:perosamine synthetase
MSNEQIMIPHNKPTIEQDDLDIVADTLKSKWIGSGGKNVSAFEREISTYLNGNGKSVATESGTAALHLALLSLNIKKGDEVILPSYVCSAVLNSINYIGAKPVLADINSSDFNISYESARKKITSKTKAIIVPHIYGIPADIEDFLGLDIPIIEDCAQSIGAQFRKTKVGNFGEISIFSFYASKLLTTAKGGAVYSKNNELTDYIHDLVDFDCRPSYKIRYNYRLSDFQAALGISQLRKLDGFIARRKTIAEQYTEIIGQKKRSSVVRVTGDEKENVWYRYVIISDKKPETIREEFLKEGITVINPLEPWELLHNYLNLNKGNFPNAEKMVKLTISIPIFPSLTDDDIEKISHAIGKIYD